IVVLLGVLGHTAIGAPPMARLRTAAGRTTQGAQRGRCDNVKAQSKGRKDVRRRPTPASLPPGLAARQLAHALIAAVQIDRRPLDQALAEAAARPETAAMEQRDRAFARLLAATVLRRLGELEQVLRAFLEKPLPGAGRRVWPILLAGAAQLL